MTRPTTRFAFDYRMGTSGGRQDMGRTVTGTFSGTLWEERAGGPIGTPCFYWWAKVVSNHRPPACKTRTRNSACFGVIQNGLYYQGIVDLLFRPVQARFGSILTLMLTGCLLSFEVARSEVGQSITTRDAWGSTCGMISRHACFAGSHSYGFSGSARGLSPTRPPRRLPFSFCFFGPCPWGCPGRLPGRRPVPTRRGVGQSTYPLKYNIGTRDRRNRVDSHRMSCQCPSWVSRFVLTRDRWWQYLPHLGSNFHNMEIIADKRG
jgi:hypothetical protein